MHDLLRINRKISLVSMFNFLLIFSILFFSILFEPYNLQVKEASFDLFPGEGSPVNIVLISDIQEAYQHPDYFQRVIKTINSHDPDLVLIAGDHVERMGDDWEKLDLLKDIQSKHGVYAILGNHDYAYLGCRGGNCSDKVETHIKALGIDVLRNENRNLEINGRRFSLIGVDELYVRNNNYTKASEGTEPPLIVLVHNQMAVANEKIEQPALILSGHTHCSQIKIPFVSEFFFSATGAAKVLGGKGTFEDSQIYVSCGVTPGYMRFLAPPEINVIKID